MISVRQAPAGDADGEKLESLYYDLIEQYYEKNNRREARKLASRLEKLLPAAPEYASSIRGEEVRSLIAELHGDLIEAARCREAEIRKILELHALAAGTPNWRYVSRQYSFYDLRDRLDLLAILYDQQGQLDRAIAVLLESKHYCHSHRIQFDSQDLLDELAQEQSAARERRPA